MIADGVLRYRKNGGNEKEENHWRVCVRLEEKKARILESCHLGVAGIISWQMYLCCNYIMIVHVMMQHILLCFICMYRCRSHLGRDKTVEEITSHFRINLQCLKSYRVLLGAKRYEDTSWSESQVGVALVGIHSGFPTCQRSCIIPMSIHAYISHSASNKQAQSQSLICIAMFPTACQHLSYLVELSQGK